MHPSNVRELPCIAAYVFVRDMREIARLTIHKASKNTLIVRAVYDTNEPDWTFTAGSAGGGGYCKASAAAYDAVEKAGVYHGKCFSGRGMEAAIKCLEEHHNAKCFVAFIG